MKGGLRSGAIATRNLSGTGAARGIKNLGNTCFLNVVLQSLMSLRSFHAYLHSGAAATTSMDTPLVNALRHSMQELSRPLSSPFDPTPMVMSVPVLQNTFAHGQHDPEELLHHLMTVLDDEKGPKETSKAKEETRASSTTVQSVNGKECDRWNGSENPFAGRLVSKIFCRGCRDERSQTHSFIDLSLAIPSGTESGSKRRRPSLNNCLELFTRDEELTGVRCDRCVKQRRDHRSHAIARVREMEFDRTRIAVGRMNENEHQHEHQHDPVKNVIDMTNRYAMSQELREKLSKSGILTIDAAVTGVHQWSHTAIEDAFLRAKKKLSIAKPPHALCLHLQRLVTQPGFRDTALVKRNDKVDFEISLDLSPYCEKARREDLLYNLTAVIVHHGSQEGGHFTVYRRLVKPESAKYTAQFLQRTTRTEERDWVHISDEICQRVSEEKVLNASAYMLFYEKDSSATTTSSSTCSSSSSPSS